VVLAAVAIAHLMSRRDCQAGIVQVRLTTPAPMRGASHQTLTTAKG
jgi:hypothetical protein